MQPTKILSVTPVRVQTGRGCLWECDNKQKYLTKDMAAIIGTTPQVLMKRFYTFGLNNKKLFRPSTSYRKTAHIPRPATINGFLPIIST